MNFKIFGLDKLTAKIKRLTSPQLTREMEKTTQKAVHYVHGKVPPYSSVPKPIGSTYVRQGTLGKSINTDVKTMGSNVVGTIGSALDYSPYVIDEEKQAGMHRGRWYTLQGVVKKAQAAVNKFFEDMVKRLTR